MGAGFGRRRWLGAVPVRPPVVLEVLQPIGHRRDAAPGVGQREGRPVGEVTLGRRSVPEHVAQRQLGERFLTVEAASARGAVGDQGVRVLVADDGSAADERCRLGRRGDQRERLPLGGQASLEQVLAQLGARLWPAGGDRIDDGGDGPVERLVVDAEAALVLPVELAERRAGQLEQPDEVVGHDEVPRRAQHVRAQQVAGAERGVEVVGRRRRCQCGRRPPSSPGCSSRLARRAGRAPPSAHRAPSAVQVLGRRGASGR